MVFPGVNIVAARAAGTSMGTPVGDLYTRASGTSMATPHAAGVAALLLEGLPSLTPEELKLLLQATAVDLGLDSNTQGSGRADAYAALPGEVPPAPPPPPPEPPPEPPTPIPIPSGCLTLPLQVIGLH